MRTYTVQGIPDVLEVKLLSYRGDDIILSVDPEVYHNAIVSKSCHGSSCPYSVREDSCQPLNAYGLDRSTKSSLDNIKNSTATLANGSYYIGDSNNGTYQHDWAYYLATADTDNGRNGFKNQLEELIARNPNDYLYSNGFTEAPGNLKYFVVTGGAYKSSGACYYAGYMRVFFKYLKKDNNSDGTNDYYNEFYRNKCLMNIENYNSEICRNLRDSDSTVNNLVYNYCIDDNKDKINKLNTDSALQPVNSFKCLYSLNSKYKGCQQYDGNFVIYDENKRPIFSTGSYGNNYKNNSKIIMQADNNLVQYTTNTSVPYWNSATSGKGRSGGFALLQNDGNFVVYDGDTKPIWASNTGRNNEPSNKVFSSICNDLKDKNDGHYNQGIEDARITYCLKDNNLLDADDCKQYWRLGDNDIKLANKTKLDDKAKEICDKKTNDSNDKVKLFCSCLNPPDNIKEIQQKLMYGPKCTFQTCKDSGYRVLNYNQEPCPPCVQNMDAKGPNISLDDVKQSCNIVTQNIYNPPVNDSNNITTTQKIDTQADINPKPQVNTTQPTIDKKDIANKNNIPSTQKQDNTVMIIIISIISALVFISLVIGGYVYMKYSNGTKVLHHYKY